MQVEALIADERWNDALGGAAEAFAHKVLQAAAAAEGADGEVSVLFADADELRRLNKNYRGEDKATNVLAFPAAVPAGGLIGDIAFAYSVVHAEAQEQGKSFADHAAHLLTHGFLHLLGYDHMQEQDAERMEARERAILAALGVKDPYALERA